MKLHVLNPVARKVEKGGAPAPRLSKLEGKPIGLYWNRKAGGDAALKRVEQLIKTKFPGVATRSYIRKSLDDSNRYAIQEDLKRIAGECAGVIGSTAECGTCTSWLAHDMAQLEKIGVPTVSFVANDLTRAWQVSATLFGVNPLPQVTMPRPFAGLQSQDIQLQVDATFDALMKTLTQTASQEALVERSAEAGDVIVVEASDGYAALESMNRVFLDCGWGDGFPIWPPTREKVDAMLRGTHKGDDEVIAVLAPGMGIATVEKIAINAVMSGCRHEHLPVLLAAVKAISDPRFMLRNVTMSTGAHAPLMLLNGPIVKRLGVNSGRCALGPGAQSEVNTVLGRAMRLIYMNLGHAYPGVMDMDTLGSPTKYSMCLGENEDASPWEPYHVEKGYDRDASVVTMHSTYALCEVEDGAATTAEAVLTTTCSTACNMGVKGVGWWLVGGRSDPQAGVTAKDKSILLVCPVHAEIFRKQGWSKQQIRDYLYKHARLPFGPFMATKSAAAFRSSHPQMQWLWDSPDTLMPVLETPDCYEIVVAGGMAGARSTYSYGAAEPISELIEH